MSRKAETVGTVRERERERELHFSKRECGFVRQSDTSKLLENKNKKVNKENIIEIWKKDSDET